MVIPSFTFARLPRIYFGAGRFAEVGKILRELGKTVLVVTGSESLKSSGRFDTLLKLIESESLNHLTLSVGSEPSPGFVDGAVSDFKGEGIDVVLAVGGGSALDAGKAISAMLFQEESVINFLEGVGSGKPHNGLKVPVVAIPTTSGTGSEATKNAVLSKVGPEGYKKSMRHDNFVPEIALIDPELMLSCPADITAAAGLDACTQLLEAYVSTKATPLTDALALSGLEQIKNNLALACADGANDVEVRAGMAYAALLSGIVLANAGLGIVHGLASPIGGHFPIPHGVICGTLLEAATKENIQALMDVNKDHPVLHKYAEVGRLFSNKHSADVQEGCNLLIEQLERWTEELKMPNLSDYGMQMSDIDNIIEETGHKNNPVSLSRDRIRRVLVSRM